MKIKSYLLKKHKKDCVALEMFKAGTWSSPFVIGRSDYIGLPNQKGRQSKKFATVFICNDPQCRSKMAVIENDILDLVDHSGLAEAEED